MDQIQPQYIFESPDGKTIYRRTMGNPHRELHLELQEAISMREKLQEDQLWQQIRNTAEKNKQLARMLDEVKVYYRLISEN